MPPPINFITKKFAVTNQTLECADIIIKALSDLLNKPQKYEKTEFGFHIKARKGLIYDPQLIEIYIVEKTGSLNYTIIQTSFGITPKGFGEKSEKLTKQLLLKGIDEIIEQILPAVKLIGIDEQNICLECGKVNFPMAGFCVQCNEKLLSPIRELPIKEISSIVDDIGIIEEVNGEIKSEETQKQTIPDLMDTITGIINGKVDPTTFKEKLDSVTSFELGRCKYCNWVIEEKEYMFRDKGYEIRCRNCNKILD